ncbi:MAG: hypothetical protein ACMUIS_05650 [bacterium]
MMCIDRRQAISGPAGSVVLPWSVRGLGKTYSKKTVLEEHRGIITRRRVILDAA